MERRATSVHRQGNEYITFDKYDNEIGKAGAVNFKGTVMAFGPGVQIEFHPLDVRVEEKMHSDGVLFLEE